jgi:Uma2 family endonuclease
VNQLLMNPFPGDIVYPESDGKPMADNTKQFRWITVLYGNIAALFRLHPDVFVSGNQFWYPVEGHLELNVAPDVYVVFGRPKGDRPSYKQWEEGNVPMTVVFEVLSPSNGVMEGIDKHSFYEDYGVEEYYIYDPDSNRLSVYLRQGDMLRRVRQVQGFISPRLGIRFELSGSELVVFTPSGRPFLTFEELEAERQRLEAEVNEERSQRLAAQQQAVQAQQGLARFAELSRKARRQQATPQELEELERLEGQA